MHPKKAHKWSVPFLYICLYNWCHKYRPLPSNLTFCKARRSWRRDICLKDTHTHTPTVKICTCCILQIVNMSCDARLMTVKSLHMLRPVCTFVLVFGPRYTLNNLLYGKIKIYFFNSLFNLLSCSQCVTLNVTRVFPGCNVHAFVMNDKHQAKEVAFIFNYSNSYKK